MYFENMLNCCPGLRKTISTYGNFSTNADSKRQISLQRNENENKNYIQPSVVEKL